MALYASMIRIYYTLFIKPPPPPIHFHLNLMGGLRAAKTRINKQKSTNLRLVMKVGER